MARTMVERINNVSEYVGNKAKEGGKEREFYADLIKLAQSYINNNGDLLRSDKSKLRGMIEIVEREIKNEKTKEKIKRINNEHKQRERTKARKERQHKYFILGGGIMGLDEIQRNRLILEACLFGALSDRDMQKFGVKKSIYDLEERKKMAKEKGNCAIKVFLISNERCNYWFGLNVGYDETKSSFYTFHRYQVIDEATNQEIYKWLDRRNYNV